LGGRFYKTGDLGRVRPDGKIEFVGRTDSQVRIKGFRVELEEIRALLTMHPLVADAAVEPADEGGENRLEAFVEPFGDSITAEDLRQYLQARLPEYMIPSYFTFAAPLPKTDSGKIDRRALKPCKGKSIDTGIPFVSPTTTEQIALAAIWKEVLGISRVGINDSFFALGGDSITAMRIIGRVRTFWKRDIPVRTLFEKPTIEEFAEVLN
jgi:aryl carrier-like protein